MKHSRLKQNIVSMLIPAMFILVIGFPVASEPVGQTLKRSPTPTVSAIVTQTRTPKTTVTVGGPSATFTSTSLVLPTNTKQRNSTSTVTSTVSLAPTALTCAPPTPEPLWVEPVTSPTDQLSQIIKVYIGHGKEVTVTSESGTFTVTGNFNAYTNPALVQISLLPGVTHHLEVTAKVEATGNGCTYSYTLRTTRDRQGAPLEIVQTTSNP